MASYVYIRTYDHLAKMLGWLKKRSYRAHEAFPYPLLGYEYGRIDSIMDTSASKTTFWSMLVCNFVVSALSITNLGLISSMVGFILHQKGTLFSLSRLAITSSNTAFRNRRRLRSRLAQRHRPAPDPPEKPLDRPRPRLQRRRRLRILPRTRCHVCSAVAEKEGGQGTSPTHDDLHPANVHLRHLPRLSSCSSSSNSLPFSSRCRQSSSSSW